MRTVAIVATLILLIELARHSEVQITVLHSYSSRGGSRGGLYAKTDDEHKNRRQGAAFAQADLCHPKASQELARPGPSLLGTNAKTVRTVGDIAVANRMVVYWSSFYIYLKAHDRLSVTLSEWTVL